MANMAKTVQSFPTTYPAANYLPEDVSDIVNASLKVLSCIKGSPSPALAAAVFMLAVQELAVKQSNTVHASAFRYVFMTCCLCQLCDHTCHHYCPA